MTINIIYLTSPPISPKASAIFISSNFDVFDSILKYFHPFMNKFYIQKEVLLKF